MLFAPENDSLGTIRESFSADISSFSVIPLTLSSQNEVLLASFSGLGPAEAPLEASGSAW
jgi:hypothetical protein